MTITQILNITNITFENFDSDYREDKSRDNYTPKYKVDVPYYRQVQECQTYEEQVLALLLDVIFGIHLMFTLLCIILQYSRTKSLIRAVFRSMIRAFNKYTCCILAFFIRRMELYTPDDPEFGGSDRFSIVETRDVGTSPLYSADELSSTGSLTSQVDLPTRLTHSVFLFRNLSDNHRTI